MRWRSVYLTLGVCLAAGALVAVLAALLRHERAWYRRAAAPQGPERRRLSDEFYVELSHLMSVVGKDPDWDGQFSDGQVNSYFEDGFVQSGTAARMLPRHIRDFRIAFLQDRLRVAFRYGRGPWSAVVSLEAKMWIGREPNALALELVGFHVGALPLAVQSILKPIADAARDNGIEVSWYRNPDSGNPVAVLRFQADRPRPTLQLRSVQLTPGRFTVQGRSTDAGQAEAPRADARP